MRILRSTKYQIVLVAAVAAVLTMATLASRAATAETFNVASFNILGNKHTEPGGGRASWPSGTTRLPKAMAYMETYGFHVVGLQEFEPAQRSVFMSKYSSSWGVYPTSATYTNRFSANSIIWKKSKFNFVAGGKINVKYFGTERIDIPWVKLQQKATGKSFYVINTHDPVTNANQPLSDTNRIFNSAIYLKEVAAKMLDAPVFLTGDFNSAFEYRSGVDVGGRLKITYCLLTATNILENSFDVRAGSTFGSRTFGNIPICPTQSSPGSLGSVLGSSRIIDHIYVTSKVKVHKWALVNGNVFTDKISDHRPIRVTVTLK